MNRTDGLNIFAMALALVCAVIGVIATTRHQPPISAPPLIESETLDIFSLPDGRRAIKDAHGTLIPVGNYQRIVSLCMASDAILAEICEPKRIVAVSTYLRGPLTVRLSGITQLAGLENSEAIIAAQPDIVFVSASATDLPRMTRLREAGLIICDLGEQGGVNAFVPNIRRVAHVLNIAPRGDDYVRTFMRRLNNVDASLPSTTPRKKALYLGVFGKEIYGGTVGSSFHDVLTHAGLMDVAADKFTGWPALSFEQVLHLNPEVIVLSPESAHALRAWPGASALSALQRDDGLITIAGELLEDPGPGILDAAEAVFHAAYPDHALK
jgi:iron complex transport system substrate-binding protein